LTKSFIIITSLLFISILTSCTDIAFDAEKWKSWNMQGSDSNLRWDMADDLIENYHLKGKTKKEIVALLGEPMDGVRAAGDVFSYDLGPCRRGIDFGGLYLTFFNGRVVKIEKSCN
jgi:hypothetical protein